MAKPPPACSFFLNSLIPRDALGKVYEQLYLNGCLPIDMTINPDSLPTPINGHAVEGKKQVLALPPPSPQVPMRGAATAAVGAFMKERESATMEEMRGALTAAGFSPKSITSIIDRLIASKSIKRVGHGIYAAIDKSTKHVQTQRELTIDTLKEAHPNPVRLSDIEAAFTAKGLRKESTSVVLNALKNDKLATNPKQGLWVYVPPKSKKK